MYISGRPISCLLFTLSKIRLSWLGDSLLISRDRSSLERISRRRVADVASIQGTQTRFSGRNRALMRCCSTTPSETEVFPFPPGPRMQTRDVSSFISNWVISSIMSSRPWKTPGISWTMVSDEHSVANRRLSARIVVYSLRLHAHNRLRWLSDSRSSLDGHGAPGVGWSREGR